MKKILTVVSAGLLLLACGSQPQTAPTAAVEVPPKVESLVQPTYPEDARRAGAEGTAIVEVTVSADGAVLGCSLATSSGNSLLDRAAIGAAQSSKFAPGAKDGKPAVMKIRVPFRFKLADTHSERRGEAQDGRGWAVRCEPSPAAREA